MSDDSKKISITGQSNRYAVKRACAVPKQETRATVYPDVSHYEQQRAINRIFADDEFDLRGTYVAAIRKKLNGYAQQDKRKGVYDDTNIISESMCIEKLVVSKLSCHYCKSNIVVLYNSVREKKQWTLDRIDNDGGHTLENVVISCLECNLQRRRTDIKKFEFTKSLKILKKTD